MTKLQAITAGAKGLRADTTIALVFENELKQGGEIGAEVISAAKSDSFKGKSGQILLAHQGGKGLRRVLAIGLGALKDATAETLRRAAGQAAQQLKILGSKEALLLLPSSEPKGLDHLAQAAAAAEGITLGAYSYDECRGKKPELNEVAKVSIQVKASKLAAASKELRDRSALSEAVRFTRDLVNRPPSDTYPEAVAKEALKIGKIGKNIRVKVLRKKQIEEKKMAGLLGVNRGSHRPPVFLDLHYKPAGAKKKIALVGKGVTFDSGGLSLKPPKSMEDMKCDMAGCASVLGMILAASRMGLKVEIHAICPVTENMTGGDAMKPGDVLRYSNGVTAEVLNTDAEGRLILADALIYASKLRPDQIIDFATLTGAAVVALGLNISALLGDQTMVDQMKAAGEKSGEAMWQLPLHEAYKAHIRSRLADIKNIGQAGEAGTITAALFLQNFVTTKKWLHVDIAGPAFLNMPDGIHPAQATGTPVRSVIEYLKGL